MKFPQKMLKPMILSGVMFLAGATAATSFLVSKPNQISAAIAQTSQDTYIDEAFNIKFQALGCMQGSKEIQCDILMTNLGDATKYATLSASYYSSGNSRIVTADGEEIEGDRAIIGNSQYSYATAKLVVGVPVRAKVTFKPSKAITQINLLDLSVKVADNNSDSGSRSNPTFRNVALKGASKAATGSPKNCP
jgi:hypothetical protein